MWNLGNNRGPYWGQSQTVSVDASVESRQTITFTLGLQLDPFRVAQQDRVRCFQEIEERREKVARGSYVFAEISQPWLTVEMMFFSRKATHLHDTLNPRGEDAVQREGPGRTLVQNSRRRLCPCSESGGCRSRAPPFPPHVHGVRALPAEAEFR